MVQSSDLHGTQTIEGLGVDRIGIGLQAGTIEPGIEQVPAELDGSTGLQTLPGSEKETENISDKLYIADVGEHANAEASLESRPTNRRKRWWVSFGACVFLIILAVSTSVPLALREKHPEHDSSTPSSTSATTGSPRNSASNTRVSASPTSVPSSLKLSGALNGTKMAITHPGDGNIHLFYQDFQFQIRQLVQAFNTIAFTGGSDLPAVVADARDETPIEVVSWPELGTHLFYIDATHTLQQIYTTDDLTDWANGTLGSLFVEVPPSITSLTAYQQRLDQTDWAIRLFYGASDGLVHELLYLSANSVWISTNSTFQDANGNAGLAASSASDTLCLFTVDEQNKLQHWTLNPNDTISASSPYGEWKPNPLNRPIALAVNSSLSRSWVALSGTDDAIADIVCYQTVTLSIGCSYLDDVRSVRAYPYIVHSPSFLTGYFEAGVFDTLDNLTVTAMHLFFQTTSSNLVQNENFLNGTSQVTELPV
ncbi:MAG: hypothetical protein Q9218_003194 [Villophora microphyllina]